MGHTKPKLAVIRKRIPIEQLTVGMRIVALDRSWLETPFFRHRMRITTKKQIDALKACGVRIVDIETNGVLEEARVQDPDEVSPSQLAGQPTEVHANAQPSPPVTSFEEELPIARQVYREAKKIVEQAMHDVRMGREINADAVNRVVTEMADSILRNEDALTSLSRLKSFDEYTFFHSVNTSILALALGRKLDMDRTALEQLGIGSLLHDIGKTKVPLEVLNKPGRLDPSEYEIIKQHALRGAEILSQMTGVQDEIVRPALEHHERVDGTGYPFGRTKRDLSLFGLISSVVDIYDAITSDRVYHKAKPPYQALQILYGLGQSGHLDSTLVQRFIQCVGVYPVGSCVALNTGEIAVVSRINRHEPLRPTVLVVKDGDGCPIASPKPLDLAAQSGKPIRRIETVLNPDLVGLNPELALGGAAE